MVTTGASSRNSCRSGQESRDIDASKGSNTPRMLASGHDLSARSNCVATARCTALVGMMSPSGSAATRTVLRSTQWAPAASAARLMAAFDGAGRRAVRDRGQTPDVDLLRARASQPGEERIGCRSRSRPVSRSRTQSLLPSSTNAVLGCRFVGDGQLAVDRRGERGLPGRGVHEHRAGWERFGEHEARPRVPQRDRRCDRRL